MESAASLIKIDNLMIAANCNTVINGFSFNKSNKLIAYAAANSILILDPYHIQGNVPKVLFCLRGHQDRVNGLMWLNTNHLVSISSDKSFFVWGYTKDSDPKDPKNWTYKRVYENAHEQAINYLTTYSPNENEYYLLTTCAGGKLRLF